MKNHVRTCKNYPPNLDKKQKLSDLESKTTVNDDAIPNLWEFNQDVIRKALAKMLIVDELPFSFVEREGFREFMKVVNPHFLIPSRSTSTKDCYSYFIDERRKLLDMFKTLSSRVCLTTDTWTSGQNLCYMCLTAHFIDDDWRLHKRIINFCPIVGHSGVLIGRAVEECLIKWGLKNILTVTVDNASSNDVAINHLKKVLKKTLRKIVPLVLFSAWIATYVPYLISIILHCLKKRRMLRCHLHLLLPISILCGVMMW